MEITTFRASQLRPGFASSRGGRFGDCPRAIWSAATSHHDHGARVTATRRANLLTAGIGGAAGQQRHPGGAVGALATIRRGCQRRAAVRNLICGARVRAVIERWRRSWPKSAPNAGPPAGQAAGRTGRSIDLMVQSGKGAAFRPEPRDADGDRRTSPLSTRTSISIFDRAAAAIALEDDGSGVVCWAALLHIGKPATRRHEPDCGPSPR